MEALLEPGMCFTAYYAHEHDSPALHLRLQQAMTGLFPDASDASAVSVEFASHQSTVIYIRMLKATIKAMSIGQIIDALQCCSQSGARPVVTVACEPDCAYELQEEGEIPIKPCCISNCSKSQNPCSEASWGKACGDRGL